MEISKRQTKDEARLHQKITSRKHVSARELYITAEIYSINAEQNLKFTTSVGVQALIFQD